MVSIYILDSDSVGVLETLIKTYEEFEKFLIQKLSNLAIGDELPLKAILGRESRRFHGYLKTHETQLISNITSGIFNGVRRGKVETFVGSKEKFQHYIKT